MRLSRMGLLFTLCALLPSIIFGATPAEPAEESIVHVKMYGENTSIQPGKPFWLAVQLNIVEHWHVYWKHPGQAGMPTELWWNLPEGFKAGEIQWPTPKHFESNGMVAFGYEGNPVLLVEITPPAQLEIGENVNLSADVTWVACHDSCIPGDQSVSISLPVSRFEPLKDVSSTHIFEDARAALPKPLKVAVSTEGDNIELTFDSPENFGVRRLVRGYLFSDNDAMLELNLGPASGEHGDTPGVARLQIPILNNGGQLPAVISGVLRLEDATGAWVAGFNIDAPLNPIASTGTDPIAVPASPVAGSPNTGGAEAPMTIVTFLLALGGAFLGGLLLNLMPCVMPVISLKILGFVKMAGKEDRGAFWYGLAFTGGVLSSFLALASMLLILQASGSAVGWGFQLQEPGFVAVMCFVLVLVGLNFFGVFEMGTSVASAAGSLQTSGSHGLYGAFSSGVLATALATPCTGPFLGTAIGFAATLSPIASLLVFSFIGLGMSSPYLFLSAYPPALAYLPKPGNWMITFKQSMGFVMLATVIWLLWVFSALTSPSTIFFLLAYLLVASFAAWVYGRWGSPIHRIHTRRVASVISLLLLGFSVLQSVRLGAPDDYGPSRTTRTVLVDADDPDGIRGWHSFSEEKFNALREKGVPVLVDFTARWCLICQANKIALHDRAVNEKMDALGVARLEADWTRRDPIITKFLRQFGRNGVPLYVYFPADPKAEPKVLPQTLTPDVVLECFGDLER